MRRTTLPSESVSAITKSPFFSNMGLLWAHSKLFFGRAKKNLGNAARIPILYASDSWCVKKESEMSEIKSKRIPPYLPFKTFLNLSTLSLRESLRS
jgi:hypothetical protein